MKRYSIIAVCFILTAVLAPQWSVILAVPVVVALVLFLDKGIFAYLGSRKFWIWVGLGCLILPLAAGGNRIEILGISYSLDMLLISLRMTARGFIIFTAMSMIRRHVPPQNIASFLWKIGFRKLAYMIPVAFHLVPAVMESSLKTFSIWRARGGLKRNFLRNLVVLLTGLQLQWVREAEDLTLALAIHQRENPSASKF